VSIGKLSKRRNSSINPRTSRNSPEKAGGSKLSIIAAVWTPFSGAMTQQYTATTRSDKVKFYHG
jgi:hypothetical protein